MTSKKLDMYWNFLSEAVSKRNEVAFDKEYPNKKQTLKDLQNLIDYYEGKISYVQNNNKKQKKEKKTECNVHSEPIIIPEKNPQQK